MAKHQHGDLLIAPYDCSEAVFRGWLSKEECVEGVAVEMDGEREAIGEPSHTWAHTGFWTDDDGIVHSGAVYYGKRWEGKRGSFKVTEIDTRVVDVVDPYDAKRALDGVE